MKKEDILHEIKERVDIVDLISEYVTLKRAGQNFKGLCPFHQEKTPSFTVNPSKQIFYCFGCHKGGDQIAFLMAHESLTFNEALSKLCERAGIVPDSLRSGFNYKDVLYKINKEAASFYNSQLFQNKRALDYFKSRSIGEEVIKLNELGYSLFQRDSLLKHLTNQGYEQKDILKSGLVHQGNGAPFDFFRDRIMFPIIDANGKYLAFGGRRLSEQKGVPKYINSAESPVFKKGDTLFGIHRAKGAISQKGYSMIVEGYMDVLMCHQYGFLNVTAPLGTAITEGHLKRLKKYSNNLLVVFDGDSAGISAARRTVEIAFAQSMNVKIALLPPSEDPDSFLRKHGADAFSVVLSKSLSPVAFYFRLYGKNVVDCVRKILSLLSLSADKLQREAVFSELTERSGMNELSLRQELDSILKSKDFRPNTKDKPPKIIKKETNRTEELFLKILLSSPCNLRSKLKDADLQCFEDPAVKRLLERLICVSPDINGQDLLDLLMSSSATEERDLLLRIMVEDPVEDYKSLEAAEDCLRSIVLKSIEKGMKEATQSGNIELINRLLLQKRQLSAQGEHK